MTREKDTLHVYMTLKKKENYCFKLYVNMLIQLKFYKNGASPNPDQHFGYK